MSALIGYAYRFLGFPVVDVDVLVARQIPRQAREALQRDRDQHRRISSNSRPPWTHALFKSMCEGNFQVLGILFDFSL